MADCIFCSIASGEGPAEVVDSDEHTVAFMDISPATPGHVLVIPRTHVANLLEIEPDQLRHCAAAAGRLARRIDATLEPAGINLINACGEAAWQTVFHFHIHVIPRYPDDPLELPWTPEGGEIEEIKRVADRIRAE